MTLFPRVGNLKKPYYIECRREDKIWSVVKRDFLTTASAIRACNVLFIKNPQWEYRVMGPSSRLPWYVAPAIPEGSRIDGFRDD